MHKDCDTKVFLTGDIGGTKTNIGLFVPGKTRPRLVTVETYASKEAGGIEEILERFVKKHSFTPASAVFGIAGPVIDGQTRTTNLPWLVSETMIQNHFGWNRVALINDLTATAMAVPFLGNNEVCSLNRVRRKRHGVIGVVASGTGLGEALMVYHNNQYIPISSEGGHVDFAPATEEQTSLWHYLHRKFGHVSVERVASGQGMVNIYQWLKNTGKYHEPGWLKKDMETMDPATVITKAALDNGPSLCRLVLDHFILILGAVCGNLALTVMATGGMYLGGGIPPKILPYLKKDIFMKAFTDKGRFRTFMEKIPVKVILDSRAPLIGAAIYAERMVRQKG